MWLLSQNVQSFLAVSEEGTIHRAAKRLAVTQSAVTQRLKNLETEMGVSLFLRSRKGMTLTSEGESLLLYVRQVGDLEGELAAKLSGDGKRHLVIRGPSSVMRSRIIPLVSSVMQQWESLTVEFQLVDTESAFGALKQGLCDVAILEHQEVAFEFQSKRLVPERYILVGPAAWKNRAVRDVIKSERIIDFDPSDQMTFRFLEQHGYKDLANSDRHYANNTDALAKMVVEGLGYSVLTKEFAKELIESGQAAQLAKSKEYQYPIAACWYPRTWPSDSFRDVIAALQ